METWVGGAERKGGCEGDRRSANGSNGIEEGHTSMCELTTLKKTATDDSDEYKKSTKDRPRTTIVKHYIHVCACVCVLYDDNEPAL